MKFEDFEREMEAREKEKTTKARPMAFGCGAAGSCAGPVSDFNDPTATDLDSEWEDYMQYGGASRRHWD